MTDTVETTLNRAQSLDGETVLRLAMAREARSPETYLSNKQLYDVLPHQLTAEEVNSLGVRVQTMGEMIMHSRDGFSRGRRVEVKSLRWLASNSLLHDDLVSFDNIRSHISRLGFVGRLASASLWYEQKFN